TAFQGRGQAATAWVHACQHALGRTFLDAWPFDMATQNDIRLRFFLGDVVSPVPLTTRHSSVAKNTRQTSPKVASQASKKILRDPKSTIEKWVAASHSSTVPGRVAPGDCSPGAPADPYLHFRAYGSSYH